MKILSIKFKNINNLKGENIISFEDEPLYSAGIFAITGPTGSGKSTILDVITLALFNKIPRFRGAISKSSIEGLGSVVTHHTDNASASITYEIHNQKYTSTWTVGKTRTGNFKDYEMFIYDANGTPLDLKKSEVPGKNEEIIGLKYDQFVKSIILSQGQFSKFLRADKSERGQLLENLTGASIYRKISIAAYEKYKLVRGEVDLEKDRLQHIQVLKDDEREVITSKIKIDGTRKSELDAVLEKYNLARQVKSEIQKMTSILQSKQVDKDNLNREKERYKEKLAQLEVFDKLSPILGDLTRFKDAKSTKEQLEVDINKNEKLLFETAESRKLVVAEMANLTQKKITIENFNSEMSLFEKEVNRLNQEIQHIQKKGIEIRNRINKKASNYNIQIDPKAEPASAIPKIKKELDQSDATISSAGLDINIGIEEVNKSSASAIEELNALNELQQAYESESLTKQRKENAAQELLKYLEQEEKFIPLVEGSQKLIATTRENIVLLEKQKQDAMLIAKLSDHRSELTDGEPCPLCGSLDHPYSEHVPNDEPDATDQVQVVRENLKLHEKEYANYNRKLTESQASKKLIEKQIILHEAELKKAEVEKEVKFEAYKGVEPIAKDNIATSIKKVEMKVEQFSQVLKSLQSRTALKELILDFEELKMVLNEYAQLYEKLKNKYSGSDVSEDCNLLQNRFVSASTKILTLNTVLENDKKSLKQTEEYIAIAMNKLNPQVKKLGFESIEDTAAFMIPDKEIQLLKSKKEELTQRNTTVETEIKTLKEGISENRKKDKLPDVSQIEVDQIIGDQSQNREALIKSIGEKTAILQKDDQERERIKAKEIELKKLQAKLDKWSLLNKLIGEKTGNKFANFAQGLTLQNLLVYANKRLQKLSDRYLLDKPLKDGALTVIDQYQGNIQRSVSTLSGGESFLISLALALSLSDMASKNVNLESLFIDEGFGTLDQESLDIAMNTLEKLQTESQKTVGVISHVEALKDRINIQIKLAKNAQGYGTLRVEG